LCSSFPFLRDGRPTSNDSVDTSSKNHLLIQNQARTGTAGFRDEKLKTRNKNSDVCQEVTFPGSDTGLVDDRMQIVSRESSTERCLSR
jgi:hypothetical protein